MRFAERLAKRSGGRGYHTAVVTTFAVEFAGFEQIMLPQLAAAGATNILVIADPRMSAMALSDGSLLPQQLGRDYDLYGPQSEGGVFHPKIVLQLGRDGGRAFIGSANATAAGIGGNLEIVAEIACTDEPSGEQAFVRDVWRYVETVTEGAQGASRDGLAWARDRTPWLAGGAPQAVRPLEDGSLLGFLGRPGAGAIAERFAELVDRPVERLIVLSPYWDADLSALTSLSNALGAPPVTVLLDKGGSGLPTSLPRSLEIKLVDVSAWKPCRFKHAKLMIAQSADHDHVLAGSPNCTAAALGTAGFAGANAEAAIYQRVQKGEAIQALALEQLLGGPTLDWSELEPAGPVEPIPLDTLSRAHPGLFEAEHGELRWRPGGRLWGERLVLLDGQGESVAEIAVEPMIRSGDLLTTRVDDLGRINFVQVAEGEARSSLAPLLHRGLLRARRREAASRSVAAAAAQIAGCADLQLFLLQALDELQRADVAEAAITSPLSGHDPRAARREDRSEGETLSYARFVEQAPLSRRADGVESSIAGSYGEDVRALLNRLSGAPAVLADEETGREDDWMDLGDEDQAQLLGHDLSAEQAPERPPIDPAAFVKAVGVYEAAMIGARTSDAVGGADVLRLRFWLLLLAHAGRRPDFEGGLPASSDPSGWPRLAIRILSAFFFPKNAPVTRLVVPQGHLDMPIDFLETWVTALWALDLITAMLDSQESEREFVRRLPMLRACMAKRMGLTQAEMESGHARRLHEGLERELGAGLRAVQDA